MGRSSILTVSSTLILKDGSITLLSRMSLLMYWKIFCCETHVLNISLLTRWFTRLLGNLDLVNRNFNKLVDTVQYMLSFLLVSAHKTRSCKSCYRPTHLVDPVAFTSTSYVLRFSYPAKQTLQSTLYSFIMRTNLRTVFNVIRFPSIQCIYTNHVHAYITNNKSRSSPTG